MAGRQVGSGWMAARGIVVAVAAVVVVMALRTPVSAHDNGSTLHLWNHIKALKEIGTINDATNPVDWTKLKGVPASIADGLDNIGVAGFGLGLVRPGTFVVNTSQIQRRLKSSCDKGQAIKAVSIAGDVTCTTGPQGLTKRIADTGQICDVGCTEGSLTLSPGTWAIFGKIIVTQKDGGTDWLTTDCDLHAGGLTDHAQGIGQVDNIVEWVTLNMQLMVTLTDQVNTSISCSDGGLGSAYGSDLSIIAIRLAD